VDGGGPLTVAITGATGFLGLRLLPLLMAKGEPVVVLAHAGAVPALDRIERHLRANGLAAESARDLTILETDVARPRIGLPRWQFGALAHQLTEIWHCAGSTNLAAPVNTCARSTQLRFLAPYWLHCRRYDRSALRAAGVDPSNPAPLSDQYLQFGN
jgi:thioester reductase-like protein